MEDIEVTLSDQISKLNKLNFIAAWDEVADLYQEVEDTYALTSMNTLEEAVQNIISFLGMQPAERTDRVVQGKSSHTLYLAGTCVSISFVYFISVRFIFTCNFEYSRCIPRQSRSTC